MNLNLKKHGISYTKNSPVGQAMGILIKPWKEIKGYLLGNTFTLQIEKFSNKTAILQLSLLLLPISILFYYSTDGGDYDIWWHLKYGEHYVRNLIWHIDHSQFSWTPADNPDWEYGSWLGSSIFYVLYQFASVPGLYIVQWFVILSIFAIFLYYIKIIGDSFDINHIMSLMLLAIALNVIAIYIKPEQFTILFFFVTVFIYFTSKSSSQNLFFLYPLLFFIWVNTHGGFIIGLFFISLALCGEVLHYFFLTKVKLSRRQLSYFALSVAFSYIATLINPLGFSYPANIIKRILFENFYTSQSNYIMNFLKMWRFLFPEVYLFRFVNTAWAMVLMMFFFLAATLYVYRKKRKIDITVFVLNLVFFLTGMNTIRASIFFPLIWLISMPYTLQMVDAQSIKKKFAPVSMILFLLLVGNIIYVTASYISHRSWFGTHMEELVPVKEVAFIKENRLPGPVFNDYLIGGYMIWAMPEYKVFLDPRFGPYAKQVWPDYTNFKRNITDKNLKAFNSKYPFKIALIHMRELPMIFRILKSSDWRLAYFDKVAVVIIHKSVIPLLSPETLKISIATERFKDVTNPTTLLRLFSLYKNIFGTKHAEEIVDIFKQNVSKFYKRKKKIIQKMEKAINK